MAARGDRRATLAASALIVLSACGASDTSTPAAGLQKAATAASGAITVAAGPMTIDANSVVTLIAATLPTTTALVIVQTKCTAPLAITSLPANAVTVLPATLPCVSGTVNAAVTVIARTYGVSTIVITAADQVFAYQLSVVASG